jgi:hypothetical protein
VPTAHVAVAPLADGGAFDREATVPGSIGGGYPQLVVLPAGDAIVAYTVAAGDARGVKAARVHAPG